GVFHYLDAGADNLAQVVRRNVRGHAHGNARGTVDQQVGQARGKYVGNLFGAVVVVGEVDRFLVEVGDQLVREPLHADFGVTHCRGGIAVDRAEVALAVDERIAQRKILRHAHDGFVDG